MNRRIEVDSLDQYLEMVNKVEEYILKNYDHEHCAKTEQWSEGNYSDVFADGHDAGYAYALWTIGTMLGLKLEEPKEPDYE